ncbi:50S ribosomal protein L37ae [Candidatus Woesearchaeota archaeon]|nr:50S ribosomal protein L37ae [Candidatus Woesearchaeota archaeon]
MTEIVGVGPVKRYGTRYGRTNRFKAAQIEFDQRKPQKCPFCLKDKAKRTSLGVYECSSCFSKFAEDAYFIGQTKKMAEKV